MGRLIIYLVEKLWDNEIFQVAIRTKINGNWESWFWDGFKLNFSSINGYAVLWTETQTKPLVFASKEEVCSQVMLWNKELGKVSELVEERPVKPKRRYTKKKKETKA